jgi:hypothetical protein
MANTMAQCPICKGLEKCSVTEFEYGCVVECKEENIKFFKYYSVDYTPTNDKIELRKRYSVIYEFLLKHGNVKIVNGKRLRYKFWVRHENEPLSDDPVMVDVGTLMKNYPKNVGEKLDRILRNFVARFPNVGQNVATEFLIPPLLFMEVDYERGAKMEKETLLEYLVSLKLIVVSKQESPSSSAHYKLTAQGWAQVAELTSRQKEINQGFIAMQFPRERQTAEKRKELETIIDCFKKAINTCGYAPRIMLEIERNNQIV